MICHGDFISPKFQILAQNIYKTLNILIYFFFFFFFFFNFLEDLILTDNIAYKSRKIKSDKAHWIKDQFNA